MRMNRTPEDTTERLRLMEARGTSTRDALALFDALAPVHPEAMTGMWRGHSLRTRHRLDGLLERLGWYGKSFLKDGRAHPLLFRSGDGVVAVDPRFVPAGLARDVGPLFRNAGAAMAFRVLRPALRTKNTTAGLALVEHRGVETAAMVYDRQPIRDIFRRVDDRTLLGLMEMRRMSQPFFFVLRRAEDQTGAAFRPDRATP
jgi:hypothetical protein